MLSNDDGDIPSLNWWWWSGSVLVSWWGVVVSPQGVTRSPIFHLPRRPWTKTSTWRCALGRNLPASNRVLLRYSVQHFCADRVGTKELSRPPRKSFYLHRGAKSSAVLPSEGQWLVLCAHVSIMAFLRPDKRDLLLIPPPAPPLS